MTENQFINYLNQYNVLSPNHSKIYDEYTNDSKFSFTIDTKIEKHLKNLFEHNPGSVILTGNAGDGKTRLCRTIYNHFSQQKLQDWPNDGILNINIDNEKTIRIVKDLSELKDEVIEYELTCLQAHIQNNHRDKIYYLIAANEGKLTKFLSQKKDLNFLKVNVRNRFSDYHNNTGQFSVLNLMDVTSSLYVEKVLNEWNKEEYWNACESCSKRETCIINFNHKKTTQELVKKRLVEQYRVLDYLGTHITMRELLIHISYVLTGGFICKDIHNRNIDEFQNQMSKPYYENFFGNGIEQEAFAEMGALKIFKEFDPGNYSNSKIDDFIINGDLSSLDELESIHKNLFNEDIDLQRGYFRKCLELYRNHSNDSNEEFIDQWIYKLRRKFYFEFPEGNWFDRKSLIPFSYINLFESLFNNPARQAHIRKDLITGLNRAFAKKLVEPTNGLLATNENLMIHSTFKTSQFRIVEEENLEELDHCSSKFKLIVEESTIPMDLYLFEYLMRLSVGDTHNVLKENVEILIDTFKNELIKLSESDPYLLSILRYEKDKGLYVQDEIEIP